LANVDNPQAQMVNRLSPTQPQTASRSAGSATTMAGGFDRIE